MKRVDVYLLKVLSQTCIIHSLKFALPSALLASALKATDHNFEWNYLEDIMPNDKVFSIFASTVSFLLVFRTVQALNMYRDGARGVYSMTGAWYDAASTMFAFTRTATADIDKVKNVKNTLLRLFSLMSMLCLEELENCEDESTSCVMNFSVIDAEGLDPAMLKIIRDSKCKPEIVCQMIQGLIVDNISSGVFAVPPPILSRAFQDLGNGMLKYHELLQISHVTLPFPLQAVSELLLFGYALFTPFTMALWTQGAIGAAWTTFVQICVFFTLNSLACEVENPFSGDRNDIDIEKIHRQMNERLGALNCLSDASQSQKLEIKSEEVLDTRPAQWEALAVRCKSITLEKSKEIHRSTRGNIMDTVLEGFLIRSQGRADKNVEPKFQDIVPVPPVPPQDTVYESPTGAGASSSSVVSASVRHQQFPAVPHRTCD